VPTEFAKSQVENEALIGRFRAEIQQDALGVLARLGLEVAEGGYLVTGAAPGDVLQAGLLPGDLISAVNGQPLGDPDSDIARFDLVAAVGTANLSVVRDGVTLLMTFPLK
jgi:general secretion pathway protein C